VFLAEEAARAGVLELVRNLDDGRVEARLQGPPAAVESVEKWSHHRPELAKVTEVESSDAEPLDRTSFEVVE
jgi:acylphosphatase